MPSLDTLPVEMFNEISSFACTDGSQTGSRLSQVCKSFQDAFSTTGIHIQHVSIRGVNKMESFLKFLQGRDIRAQGVRSLMLASDPAESSSLAITLTKQILEAVSPQHLQCLTVSLPSHRVDPNLPCPVLPANLPELTELSISGCYDKQSFTASHKAPKLQRFHIARYERPPENLFQQLIDFAPNMTHLKLSSLSPGMLSQSQLPTDLKSFLQEQSMLKPPNREGDPSYARLFPPSLQQIVIGFLPSYRPERMMCGFAFARYRTNINNFHEVVRSFPNLGLDDPVVILPPPGSRGVEHYKRDEKATLKFLEEEWMDRRRGDGAASWVKPLYLPEVSCD